MLQFPENSMSTWWTVGDETLSPEQQQQKVKKKWRVVAVPLCVNNHK